MKTNYRFIIAFLCSVLILFTLSSCNAKTNIPADSVALREEHNKSIVLQYFQEVLDGEQYSRMPDVFTGDVVMHRPEGTLTYLSMVHTAFRKGLSPHTIETTIHEMIASGDYVSVRLSHRMTFSTEEAFMQSRLGRFDARGKSIEWEAMAMFRFKDGKIAEEWVSADELGKLMQIGTLELSVKGQ
jgi:predicted SnoaL-like aldol condensation-catalyzing enzyme